MILCYSNIYVEIKIKHNRPDLFVNDRKRKEITLIEVSITFQLGFINSSRNRGNMIC